MRRTLRRLNAALVGIIAFVLCGADTRAFERNWSECVSLVVLGASRIKSEITIVKSTVEDTDSFYYEYEYSSHPIRIIADTLECETPLKNSQQEPQNANTITYKWTLNTTNYNHANITSSNSPAIILDPLTFAHNDSIHQLTLLVARGQSEAASFSLRLLLKSSSDESRPCAAQIFREPLATRAVHGLPIRINMDFECLDEVDVYSKKFQFIWKLFEKEYYIDTNTVPNSGGRRNLASHKSATATHESTKPHVLNLGRVFEVPYELVPSESFTVEACVGLVYGEEKMVFNMADEEVVAWCCSAEIHVSSAPLVAQVGDGTSNALVSRANNRIEIHARNSYDPDVLNLSSGNEEQEQAEGFAEIFSFSWSCELGLRENEMIACEDERLLDAMSSTEASLAISGEDLFRSRLSNTEITFFRFTVKVSKPNREPAFASQVYRFVPENGHELPFALLDAVNVTNLEGHRLDRNAVDIRENVVIRLNGGRHENDKPDLISVDYELLEPESDRYELLDGDVLVPNVGWWSEDRSGVLPLGFVSGALRENEKYVFGLIVEQEEAHLNELSLALCTREEAKLIIEAVSVTRVQNAQEFVVLLKAKASVFRPTLRLYFSMRASDGDAEENDAGGGSWWCLGACSGEQTFAETRVWIAGMYEIQIELFDASSTSRADVWRSHVTIENSHPREAQLQTMSKLRNNIIRSFVLGDSACFLHSSLQYVRLLGSSDFFASAGEESNTENALAEEIVFLQSQLLPKLVFVARNSVMNARLALNFASIARLLSRLNPAFTPELESVALVLELSESVVFNDRAYDSHTSLISALVPAFNASLENAFARVATSTRGLLMTYNAVKQQLSHLALRETSCGFEQTISTAAIATTHPPLLRSRDPMISKNSTPPLVLSALVTCDVSLSEIALPVATASLCAQVFGPPTKATRRRVEALLFASPDFSGVGASAENGQDRESSFIHERSLIQLVVSGYDSAAAEKADCVSVTIALDESAREILALNWSKNTARDADVKNGAGADSVLVPQVFRIDMDEAVAATMDATLNRTRVLTVVMSNERVMITIPITNATGGVLFGVELVRLSEAVVVVDTNGTGLSSGSIGGDDDEHAGDANDAIGVDEDHGAGSGSGSQGAETQSSNAAVIIGIACGCLAAVVLVAVIVVGVVMMMRTRARREEDVLDWRAT